MFSTTQKRSIAEHVQAVLREAHHPPQTKGWTEAEAAQWKAFASTIVDDPPRNPPMGETEVPQ